MRTWQAVAAGAALMIVTGCATAPPPAAKSQVTGTVTYRERIMLPPNAQIKATLADTSRADAPAQVIDTQVFTADGRGPPFAFALNFDPARIEPNHTYTVSVRIEVDGRLRFITDTHTTVITRGAPTHVDMVAVGVPQN